jgi:hypothetical protein
MVPFPSTSTFVGRDDILAMIDVKLRAGLPTVIARIGGVRYVRSDDIHYLTNNAMQENAARSAVLPL